ncbi:MAG: hypothetical protein P4L63_03275 [Candidatus Pacebacteria bacterium]|nr:hypothetical protein [Candidatus Paceibacterota bacterium]
MTKEEIGPKVREMLGQHMNILLADMTDDLVVGKELIEHEDLQLDLLFALGGCVSEMNITRSETTLAEFIAILEHNYERRQRMLEKFSPKK